MQHAIGTGFIGSTPVVDLQVDENSVTGTSIGFVIAAGVQGSETFTLSDNAGGRFAIDFATGEITVANGGLLNHEVDQSHVVTVAVSDATGSYEEEFIIFVNEIDDLDLAVVGGLAVGENSANGTSIGSAIATPGPDAIAINQILANDSSLTYDSTTGKFYRAVEGNFTWHEANAGAISANIGVATGQLVTIRSQYENDLVQGLANSLSTPENLWLGASDQNNEGNWHWYADGVEDSADLFYLGQDPTGSAQNGAYTNWRVGDPSALGINEDFALFRHTTGLWDDTDITSSNHSYVIEWDASEVLDSFLFTLSNDAAGRFAIDSTTGEITVANGALLNHEANQAHIVTVAVSDAAGNNSAEDFTITVDNFNEGPSFQTTVTPTFTENTITNSADGAAPLATGDVDGDGDLDLFSTGTGTTIAWYENDSTGGFTVNTVDNVSGVSALTLTDVDGDGDTDLVVATSNFFSDGLVWYENDGNQNFTEHMIATVTRGANSVVTADVDSDGDIDLLVASSTDDSITWYENDGSENFSDRIISNANADGATSVATADVDGDGDLDVLSASFNDDKIAWYENDGSQGFTERVVDSSFSSARSVTTADVDGDGDIDILGAARDDNAIAWFENDGNETFTTRIITTNAIGANSVAVADVDADGDLDVLSTSFGDNTVAWYENDGSQVFAPHVISSVALGASTVAAVDLNGDGDLDVVSASQNDSRIATYESAGNLLNTFDGNPTFIENGAPVTLDVDLQVFDAELSALNNGSGDFGGATLTIERSGGANSDDVFSAAGPLSFGTTDFSLSGVKKGTFTSSVAGQIVLTFDPGVTNDEVNQVMQSLQYSHSSDAPPASVGLEWTFSDSNSGSQGAGPAFQAVGVTTVNITPVNDAPTLANIEATPVFYTEGGSPVGITGSTTVSDVDDTNIESAVVSISSNFSTDDVFNFTDQSGITGSYDSVNGTLTLTGSATLVEYQAALQSISYENTSDDPSDLTRTVTIQVNDGDDDSNIVSRDIDFTVMNDAPVLSAIETAPASYTENDVPLAITGSTTVSDVDDTNIESAVVSISNNFSVDDVLNFTDQSGITGSYDSVNGTLTLTGSASLIDYQAALQSISYVNTSDDPSDLTRTVTFLVNDGDVDSNIVSRDIDFTAVNDAPTLANIEGVPVSFTEGGAPVGILSLIHI